MVKYLYDAWGNHKVVDSNGSSIGSAYHVGNLNPFRYRGYYYDKVTGVYYLNSRYYDPVIGRFLNIGITTGMNVLTTEVDFFGNTLEGHINNLIDWLIFWDY